MSVAALIGSPVSHSLSPVIHRAGFAAAGVDWSYVAFDVAAGKANDALRAMRTLGIAGLSETTPQKDQVAECVDELAPPAAALRSVNTVVAEPGGRLVGHSTDGDGLVRSLEAEGVEARGVRVAVLGAGAAARSVVSALDRANAASIVVVNRTLSRAREVVALAPLTARVAADVPTEELSEADLIVNATSVGFGADPTDRRSIPLEPAVLHLEHLVVDLVYHPLETGLLRAARAAGARTFDGLGMLVHQAALQQHLWLGRLPDASVMRAAAEAELARRHEGRPATDPL